MLRGPGLIGMGSNYFLQNPCCKEQETICTQVFIWVVDAAGPSLPSQILIMILILILSLRPILILISPCQAPPPPPPRPHCAALR